MLTHANPLSDDVDTLRDIITKQQQSLEEQHALVQQQACTLNEKNHALKTKDQALLIKDIALNSLREQLNLLLQKRYGASSDVNRDQLGLFNEAEAPEASAVFDKDSEADGVAEVASPARKKSGRRALPEHLPRIEVIHDLAAADKICPHDGTTLKHIGDDVSEQLDIIPATIQVIKHLRKKYACPCCEQHIQTAPLTAQPIPKSQASTGTLAWVAINKYADGLPLYRQETILTRLGLALPRASLAHWMIRCGELTQPLINLLRDQLLEQPFIHLDETPVQVLKEPDKRAQSKSYMWVQAAGPPDQPLVLFDYDPSRSSQVPKRLLQDYSGALMVDGYEGYNAVCEQQTLTRLGCWAHARRKFIDAQRATKKGRTAKADYAIKLIGKLYKLEKTLKETSPERRYEQRLQQAKPLLDKLNIWLMQTLPTVPPKTALGQALHYLHHQWPRLIGYLENGLYPIDNNRVENAIRPFAIGRKNWLFSNSQAGAKASANLYSLIETAKANQIEPYAYLKYVFTELPKVQSVEDVEKLLPWGFKQSQPCG